MVWRVDVAIAAAKELDDLPTGLQGRILRLISLVETYGMDALHAPHARQIDGKLWEMRVIGKDGIARGFYVVRSGPRLLVLHVFVKKSQTTPRRAIALAWQRLKEIEE